MFWVLLLLTHMLTHLPCCWHMCSKLRNETKEPGKEGLLLIYVSVLLCVRTCALSVMYLWVQAHTLWHRCGGERATFRSQFSPSTMFWIGGRTLSPSLFFHQVPQVIWPRSVCLHGCSVSIPSYCRSAGVTIAHYCLWLFTWISGIWTWIIGLMC